MSEESEEWDEYIILPWSQLVKSRMSASDPILLPTYLAFCNWGLRYGQLQHEMVLCNNWKSSWEELSLSENILFIFYIKKSKIIK